MADEATWRDRIQVGMRLEDSVRLLPGYIREALGTIIYPQDNGLQLSRDLIESKTTSYTDGTVKDSICAHAYTIRPANDCEENCIRGAGGTPGVSMTMTSLRAEHFRVFVAVVLMDVLTKVHGHETISRHHHYTDSKSVILRVENEEYMADKKYDSTDYDIWKETIDAIEQANYIIFEFRHVKGHQRETLLNVKKELGPLTREATYNDWCDIAAEIEREDHQVPVQLCYINAAKVYLKNSTNIGHRIII